MRGSLGVKLNHLNHIVKLPIKMDRTCTPPHPEKKILIRACILTRLTNVLNIVMHILRESGDRYFENFQ